MAITTFIPTVWSARLLAHLDSAHVATQFVNRDYQGDIQNAGDRVKINQVSAVTIRDYVKNTDMEQPETLSTAEQVLVVDQAKYFHFQVDDVDAVQAAAPLMDSAMERAAYGLAQAADQYLFAQLAQGAAEENRLGDSDTPVAITSDNLYENLVQLKLLLDRQNLPAAGRRLAVSPELHGLMLLDQRFAGAGGQLAEETLRSGFVGRAAGFDLHLTNNLPSPKEGCVQLIASHPMAATFAEQIAKTEAYRMGSRFADGVKGLHLYGAKVVLPQAVAVLTASFT